MGGVISWFASTHPDGLEWSIARVSGSEELESADALHAKLARIQEKTAVLPDYGFREAGTEEPAEETVEEAPAWPEVSGGTSTAGLVGGAITLALAGLVGLAIGSRRKKTETD